jgi:transposase, IS5 family
LDKEKQSMLYGYKNHVKADVASKLMDDYTVTDASVHDSQALATLLSEKDKGQPLYADSAYTGGNQEASISKEEMINKVHKKGYKNKPLTEAQKENNKNKSKYRARVEHIFVFVQTSMKGSNHWHSTSTSSNRINQLSLQLM